MSIIPIFKTERLILKAPTEDDAPAYRQYFVDYEVIRHLSSGVPWPYPDGGVLDFMKENIIAKQGNDNWFWGLFLKENPSELIGGIELWRKSKPENRGFWLGRKFWGRGLMTEAVNPIMDYAFNDLGFKELFFSNAKGNDKSRRIKEKTGAKLIKIEACKFVDPKYKEHEVWEITKEEWESFKVKPKL